MKIVTDLSVTSAPARVHGGWSPRWLFRNGAKGCWFAPSNMSTLFQNAEGTIPARQPGQSIGLMLDRSGRDLHAAQTAAARPVLAVEPATGRRNLSSRSEPSVAELAVFSGVSDATTGLAGFDATIQFPDDATAIRYAYRDHGAEASTEYTLSCFVRMNDGGAPSPGADFDMTIGNAAAGGSWGAVGDLGDGLFRVSKTDTSLASNLSNTGVIKLNAHSARGFRVSGFQLEEGPAVSAYQKAVSAYDLTEVGTSAVHALDFDGVDDRMLTGTLDLTHTSQVTVVAAVSKASNPAGRGTVVNFVDNGFNSFSLEVPQPTYPGTRWLHAGNTTLVGINHALAFDAPVLYTGLSDIGAPRIELRANGASAGVSTAATGGGNFKSGPLGIGDYVNMPGRCFHGRIYGLLVVDRILTASEIAMVEAYMATRSGVTL